MVIQDAVWFFTVIPRDSKEYRGAGIVLTKDIEVTGLYKAFIGIASGDDPDQDANFIAQWGTKLTYEQAKSFFPQLDDKEQYAEK